MRSCKPLEEYSWFINEINDNLSMQTEHDVVAAVGSAIRNLPDDFVIRDFLIAHKAEVEGMLDTEYNEAEVKELFKAEGRAEGRKEGEDSKAKDIARRLLKKGNSVDEVSEDTGLDRDTIIKLMEDITNENG